MFEHSMNDMVKNWEDSENHDITTLSEAITQYSTTIKENPEKPFKCKCKKNVEFECIKGSFCPDCGYILPF